jgi:hypothetical protein
MTTHGGLPLKIHIAFTGSFVYVSKKYSPLNRLIGLKFRLGGDDDYEKKHRT